MANRDLHISSVARYGDVIRTYLFQINIAKDDGGDLNLLAREATWSGRTNTQIETYFLGMKQFFPGKEEFSGDLTLQFEEHEDQTISKILYKMKQEIFDVTKGASNAPNAGAEKLDLTNNIKVSLLAYNGEKLPLSMLFKNCWIKNVDDVSLSMSGGEAMMVGATFQYDYWVYIDSVTNAEVDAANL